MHFISFEIWQCSWLFLLTVQTGGALSLCVSAGSDDTLARLALLTTLAAGCILAWQTVLLIGQSPNLPITRDFSQSGTSKAVFPLHAPSQCHSRTHKKNKIEINYLLHKKHHLISCFKNISPSHHTQPCVIFILFSSAILIVNCDKMEKLFPLLWR